MSAINELKETLEQTITAQFVTTMLRDISAIKLQAIRALFEANTAYFSELHELVGLVQSYAGENDLLPLLPSKQPKRICVAVTSNKRFYGTLNHEIMRAVEADLLSNPRTDCLIVGQTGRQIADISPLPCTPTFFSFAKDEPTEAELLSCVSLLGTYTEIFVIHPTFINSFQQHALVTDLTHNPHKPKEEKRRTIDYVFEPEIPKIIEFFATQIRLVLFSRVMLETRLALTGARLMKMQHAREKAGELVLAQRRIIHKETSTVKSMRLLETFSGFHRETSI